MRSDEVGSFCAPVDVTGSKAVPRSAKARFGFRHILQRSAHSALAELSECVSCCSFTTAPARLLPHPHRLPLAQQAPRRPRSRLRRQPAHHAVTEGVDLCGCAGEGRHELAVAGVGLVLVQPKTRISGSPKDQFSVGVLSIWSRIRKGRGNGCFSSLTPSSFRIASSIASPSTGPAVASPACLAAACAAAS